MSERAGPPSPGSDGRLLRVDLLRAGEEEGCACVQEGPGPHSRRVASGLSRESGSRPGGSPRLSESPTGRTPGRGGEMEALLRPRAN